MTGNDQTENTDLLGGATAGDLVEYQSDAVVSRTLVKKKEGTVTLFAFAAGQGLSEHQTPYDALVLVVDGVGEFTVGGATRPIGPGEILLLPANVPHAVDARQPFKMILTMIRSQS